MQEMDFGHYLTILLIVFGMMGIGFYSYAYYMGKKIIEKQLKREKMEKVKGTK